MLTLSKSAVTAVLLLPDESARPTYRFGTVTLTLVFSAQVTPSVDAAEYSALPRRCTRTQTGGVELEKPVRLDLLLALIAARISPVEA